MHSQHKIVTFVTK